MKFSRLEGDFKNRKVFLSLQNTDKLTKQGITQAFHLIGQSLIKTAKKGILDKKKKTGKVYRVARNSRVRKHQASATGEYPASITGSLWRSLGYEGANSGNRLEFGAGGRSGKLGKNGKLVDYAKYLEKGTKNMGSRPFLQKSFQANFRNIEKYIDQQVKIEILKQ